MTAPAVEHGGDEPLPEAIARWIAADPEYGVELSAMAESDRTGLDRLFDGRIAFGTAGLRAEMGPGPRRMNRLVVQQTTAGLMDWLPSGAKVVIGYDARHNSRRYASDVADVVVAKGGKAELIDRPSPTPILALAVLDRSADAGVMITASHNPAADNGYKLYLDDGIQLVSPADAEIAAAIDRVAESMEPDLTPSLRWGTPPADAEPPVDISAEAIERHHAVSVATLYTEHRDVAVLYTAMHGVGGEHLLACFKAAGFPRPAVVEEQFRPDPEFPTAPFPNPEEPGAFDLAYAAVDRIGAGGAVDGGVDIILANDPDADRLAVGVADDAGTWRRLSGDEVGALLIDHVLRHRLASQSGTAGGAAAAPAVGTTSDAASESAPETVRGTPLLVSSIVSSRFVDRLAEAAGAESIRTLTGFKWVARPIVERPDDTYLLGYEEALGYCIGDRVRDKDGITAALVMAELAAECKAEGTTVLGRLDSLIERHGLFATSQVTVGIGDLDDHGRALAKDRAVHLDPTEVAGIEVVGREDLSKGLRLPPTSGVVLDLADGSRVIVRPSGTEPKIKAYLEVIEAGGPAGYAKEARRKAELRLGELAKAVEALLAG